GGFTRDAFPGNRIPTNRFSPISQKIGALIPAPLFPDRLSNNYLAPLTSPLQDDHNFSIKMDHQFSEKHKVFGTFIFTDRPAIRSNAASVQRDAEDHNPQYPNSRLVRLVEDWNLTPTT